MFKVLERIGEDTSAYSLLNKENFFLLFGQTFYFVEWCFIRWYKLTDKVILSLFG